MTLVSPDGGTLDESDVRLLVRLMADVAVAEGGISAQKRMLIEGIAQLIQADHWMWNVSRVTGEGAVVAVSLLHNLTDKQLALVAQENYSAPDNPFNAAVNGMCAKHGDWSGRLEDVIDIEAEAERLYTQCPKIDMEQSLFVFRQVPADPGLFSAVGLHRSHGSQPFTTGELRLAHIVIGEVQWLHEEGVPLEKGRAASGLAPRQQTVLALLMDGQSAKQIAGNLELSEHTVRGYVKDIYRHFDVGSRASLLRHFMVGTP